MEKLHKISEEIAEKFAEKFATSEIKEFIEQTKSAEDSGTFEVVITNESIDRMGEVIKSDGWELDNYMKNPVVLWGHSHSTLPIGVCTELSYTDGKLVAKGKFASADANPLAQQIRKLYDLGIVRATSVGFIEKEREGNLITKAELLEFSFVSVPANPMALSTLVKSGISINEMVTKGIMTVSEKEEEVPEVPSEEPEVEEPVAEETPEESTEPETLAEEPEVTPEEPTEEKKFDKEAVKTLISSIKEQVEALEDAVNDSEPEREDVPTEETEEQKALREFAEKRRSLQIASTVLADVLAETRQVIEARKQTR